MAHEKRITERDMQVLNDLYKLGSMGAGDISAVRFPGLSKYGNKRLRDLARREILGTVAYKVQYPDIKQCRKLTSMYYLTTKGVREVMNAKGIPVEGVIRHTRPEPEEMTLQYRKSGIYRTISEQLSPESWESGLEYKRRQQIPYNLKLDAVIHPPADVTGTIPQSVGLNFLDEGANYKITNHMQHSIDKLTLAGLRHHIILVASGKTHKQIKDNYLKDSAAAEIRILTDEEAGTLIPRLLTRPGEHLFELVSRLKTVYTDLEITHSLAYEPAPLKGQSAQKKAHIYMAELVSQDLAQMRKLIEFNPEELTRKNYPSRIIVLVTDQKQLQETYTKLDGAGHVFYAVQTQPPNICFYKAGYTGPEPINIG